MSDTWFTSDLHIGHSNILEYSNRPFKTVDEMNEALVDNWNRVVKAGDRVYCLGDFALCDPDIASDFAGRLEGQKFFIWGNHDKAVRKHQPFLKHWVWQKDIADIKVGEQRIVLCHYALLTWNQSHRGAWSLHGHSHGSLRESPDALRTDVGVDCWDYRPVSFDELKEHMSKKNFEPVDHHGRRGGGH